MNFKTIIWSLADYGIGHDVLDQQHREIIETINLLNKTYQSSGCSDKTHGVLNELLSQYRHHLDTEEKILIQFGFSDLEEHQSVHCNFLNDVILYSLNEERNTDAISDASIEYITKWCLNHILIEDMKLKPLFKNGTNKV